ncbi:Na+/proline symporter [Salegentibacter echinorum]|uniref:Na+/proline symporter n=1 Tax=Salegentibacter echinorum TaxID=1073325 RepID=A0A1M5C5H3_SALEC|nr:sodium:solute symporter [Salegentibacter echinorum]SHF49886.1 Na+/proline symporter [Salegentibacter echinorum]
MQPYQILILIAAYFGLLFLVSFFSSKAGSNAEFFRANRQSPWYIVAFGMIGASLSGVTFISLPGTVTTDSFSYFQVVLGYTIGYAIIGLVLLPLYYRLNLTSIYSYLETRFGKFSYKTGASFFLLSRLIGSSFRLFLVANVLQLILFDELGVPYYVTVSVTIFLIWLYTFRSGIKTVVWTDTLQTFFMLLSLGVTLVVISDELGISAGGMFNHLSESGLTKIFFFEDWKSGDHFIKQFVSGAFIAIVMTGLDQDMMQKNLTCRNLKEAQKNMFSFTMVLTVVNMMFLILGVFLTQYADLNGLNAIKDELFPAIATGGELGIGVAILFILGLIAAAYSSADGTLTALTTSFSIDILNIEKHYDQSRQMKIRKQIHIVISILFIAVMMIFKYAIADKSVINKLFEFAGYTYGPLLGLYTLGLFTKIQLKDKLVPIVAILAPILSYAISTNSLAWFGFEFGFFILILNGFLTILGLILIRAKHH